MHANRTALLRVVCAYRVLNAALLVQNFGGGEQFIAGGSEPVGVAAVGPVESTAVSGQICQSCWQSGAAQCAARCGAVQCCAGDHPLPTLK